MSFHLYRLNELFSNASGTLQFIELTVGGFSGQDEWSGVRITSTRDGVTHSFTVPADLPSSKTANTSVLLATAGFAAVAGVTPDFIIPDGFLFAQGGSLNFGGVDTVNHGALPANGLGLSRAGVSGPATPTNFSGSVGSLPALQARTGTAGNDTLTGTVDSELLDALGGDDTVRTGGGDDVVLAGSGDDVVFSGPGDDSLDGGEGYDYLYYADATAGVVIDLRAGTATGGAGSDTVAGFELLFGSAFADVFAGNDEGVGFLGGDGDDAITGGMGNDHLEGNGGDDVIDGGPGIDTTAFYSAAFAVNVDLEAGTATGGLGRDTLRDIENAVGSVFGDTLKGSSVDNRLEGGDGNDRLISTIGQDTLDGGDGLDVVVYAQSRAAYTLHTSGAGAWTVDKPGIGGVDSLAGVERLQFADQQLALDLDGAAGQAARLLGAVFGPASVANPGYVGIALQLLDGGMSVPTLAGLAVEVAGARTSAEVVSLLWTNLVGAPPTSEQAAPFVALLDSGTSVADFTVAAAALDLNAANIGLVGLMETGLAFTG